MTLALSLAQHVRKTRSIPPAARDAAAKCVLDLLAAVIAGHGTGSARAARRTLQTSWGDGAGTVWLSKARSTIRGAAFANAAAACALDLDDGHRGAAGHPGAAIIPSVFAAAEGCGAHDDDILTAIALGYEIGLRISAARDIRLVPTTDSGLWCGQGVAAAVGWLRGLSAEHIANAIAIAGTTAPAQAATPYTRVMGNGVKEGIPWATANGLLAVDLAEAGLTGPVDLLNESALFEEGRLIGGLGKSWQIENVYFKPYGCCRWIHAAIDATVGLIGDNHLDPFDIERIDVATFGRALSLNNELAPSTLEGAQYSLPFCLGVAGHHGARAFLPLDEALLIDQNVLDLANRVQLSIDSSLDAMFPTAVPARVRMTVGGRMIEREVLLPKGEPGNPMDWQAIRTKCCSIAVPRLGGQVRDLVSALARSLGAGDLGLLRTALGSLRLGDESESAVSLERIGQTLPLQAPPVVTANGRDEIEAKLAIDSRW